MNRLIASLLLGLAVVALPASAADEAAKKPQASKTAAKKYSMAPNGRFHQMHGKKLELECGSCHKKQQSDLLVVDNGEPPPKGMPGPVNRSSCVSCHKQGAKPAWYGAAK